MPIKSKVSLHMDFLIREVWSYKMLTEGGLVITDISYYSLLSTGEGPTLWGNKPLYWVGLSLSYSGKGQVGKGRREKGNPHMLPTTATF